MLNRIVLKYLDCIHSDTSSPQDTHDRSDWLETESMPRLHRAHSQSCSLGLCVVIRIQGQHFTVVLLLHHVPSEVFGTAAFWIKMKNLCIILFSPLLAGRIPQLDVYPLAPPRRTIRPAGLVHL